MSVRSTRLRLNSDSRHLENRPKTRSAHVLLAFIFYLLSTTMANPFTLFAGLSEEMNEVRNSEPSPSLNQAGQIVFDKSSGV
jgi:hypothetical protein